MKEYKAKETKDLVPNKENFGSQPKSAGGLVDEFNDSVNYLGLMSDKSALDTKRSELQRRTLKRHYEDFNNVTPSINLDLPDELQDLDGGSLSSETMSLKSHDLPYGVLKGGQKPTFRQYYNRTLKSTPSILLSDTTPQISLKAQKLSNLKRKLEEIKSRKSNASSIIASVPEHSLVSTIIDSKQKDFGGEMNDVVTVDLDEEMRNDIVSSFDEEKEQNEDEEILPPQPVKQILKKTIKRQYTLGKSRDKQKVAVLLKNRSTRKKVLDACKKIKQEDIKDVKDYLRTHNFIKTGSNAPNHVLREIFESVMLTGEMINTNKDTILHNLSANS